MNQDLAELGYKVDSSQAVTANRNLDQLRITSDQLARSTQQLALQHIELKAAQEQLAQQTQALGRNLSSTETILDTLLRKLDASRQLIRGMGDDLRVFGQIQTQVENLGKAFGVTSTGLEAYYRQSQQLGFTTPQTVQSLARITEALANQTAAGQQARRVLQDYGVSLAGLGANDADKVLAKFTDKLRGFADTAQKYRSVATVLGPLDADSYGKVNEPAYVTLDEQRSRSQQSQYTRDIADRTRNAATIQRQVEKNQAEQTDLEGRYSLAGGIGTSVEQRNSFEKKAGLNQGSLSYFGTQDDRLTALRYLAANPKSDEARSARGFFGRVSDDVSNSGVGNAYRSYTSGTYAANTAEIDARFAQERRSSGFFAAAGHQISSDFSNSIGTYKGLELPDTRTLSPADLLARDGNVAQQLAGYGDPSYARRHQISELLSSYRTDGGGNPVKGDEPSAEALRTFQSAYGSTEGTARYKQLGSSFHYEAAHNSDANRQEIESQKDQQFLLSLPAEDRGKGTSYLRYLRENGGAAATQSFHESLLPASPVRYTVGDTEFDTQPQAPNPRDALRAAITGGTGLTPGQKVGFDQGQDLTTKNQNTADTQAFDLRIKQQRELTAVAANGAAALEAVTVKNTAYNQAIAAGKSGDQAKIASSRALAELDERRATAAKELIGGLAATNKLESDRIALVASAGSDPAARAAASLTAGNDTEYANLVRGGNTALSKADFLKQKQAALGNAAIGGANDAVASSEQELKNQQKLLDVAGQRQSVQDKLSRDMQIDAQFVEKMAQALVADPNGDKGIVAQIQKAIEQAKALKDQITAVNVEAQAFKLGRDAFNAAKDDASLANTPRSQRGRARAQLEVDRFERQNAPDLYGPPAPSSGGTTSYPNNNQTNLQAHPSQVGLPGYMGQNGRWGVYAKPEDGVAAGLRQMLLDQDKGYDTLSKELNRRTPTGDGANQPNVAASRMASTLGIGVNDRYDLRDPEFAARFIKANVDKVEFPGSGRSIDPDMVARGVTQGLAYDKSNPASRPGQGTGGATGGTANYRAGVDTKYDSSNRLAGVEASEESDIALGRDRSALAATRAGRSADAALARARVSDPGDPNGALKAQLQVRQLQSGYQTQAAQNLATTDQSIDSNVRLAAAYKQGGTAVGLLTDKLKLEGEERTLNLSKGQQEERASQLRHDRMTKDTADIEQQIAAQKEQNELTTRDSNLGIFATDHEIANDRARAQNEQLLAKSNAPEAEKARSRAQVEENLQVKQGAEQVGLLRDAWKEAGQAALSTLNNSILNPGQRAKDVIAGLLKSLAQIGLQSAEKGLTNSVGGVGGFLQSLLGGSSAIPAAGVGGTVTNAIGSYYIPPIAAANGAIFDGGVRMFASGGIIDRPTHFYSSGGQVNMAGEVGDEAVMPLKRMPNGALGVAGGGGGGGGGKGVSVFAPITIQGGGGGKNGAMDPAVAAKLQQHIEDTINAGVQRTIAAEKRPGGSLY